MTPSVEYPPLRIHVLLTDVNALFCSAGEAPGAAPSYPVLNAMSPEDESPYPMADGPDESYDYGDGGAGGNTGLAVSPAPRALHATSRPLDLSLLPSSQAMRGGDHRTDLRATSPEVVSLEYPIPPSFMSKSSLAFDTMRCW